MNYTRAHADASDDMPARGRHGLAPQSTSVGGSIIEPRSELLRIVLADKKPDITRTGSTSQRRPSVAAKQYSDEWAIESDEDKEPVQSQWRRSRTIRRASSQATPKNAPSLSNGLRTKETDTRIDQLQKENFDVKHRLCLVQERNRKLEEELDERAEGLERYTALKGEHEGLRKRLEALAQENKDLKGERGELLSINDALVKELEKRDAALDEAATMIHKFEYKAAELEKKLVGMQTATTEHQDSDYFSAEADIASYESSPSRTRSTLRPSSSSAQESGHFSGVSSSPDHSHRMPRPLSRQAKIIIRPDTPKPDPSGIFNNSPSNSDGLQNLILSPPVYRHQHRMAPHPPPLRRSKTHLGAVIAMPVTNPSAPQPNPILIPNFALSRPLRSLYNSGELNRRIHSDDPPIPPVFPILDGRTASSVDNDDTRSMWSTSETCER